MVSERTFARVYDLSPLTFPKLRKSNPIQEWNIVIIFLIEILVAVSLTRYIIYIQVFDIQSFVLTLNLFVNAVSLLLNLYSLLVFRHKKIVYLEDLEDFDLSLTFQRV